MQRWTAFLFLVAVLGLSALTVYTTMRRGLGPAAVVSADAGADDGGGLADAGDGQDGGAEGSLGAALEMPGVDAGGTLPSGEPAPSLGTEGPKSVVFGAVLVQYRGAQGAPANAPSHDAALARAKELAALAKEDFKAAVAKGDRGSTENAGRMPRNMLEPGPEYVLFSLPKGGVSDPVDTPRGFWIIRRIE
jgi:hypothetical protein